MGVMGRTHIISLYINPPNTDKPVFMSDMVLLFNDGCKGFEIMCRDFNVTLNRDSDKSDQARFVKFKIQSLKLS